MKLKKMILNLVCKILSEEKFLNLLRKGARVPLLAWSPDFSVSVANTKEELEAAYVLLHRCYVDQKLMSPHSSGLRCNVFSFLPESTTIIAKYRGEVVGTVTLIKDSPLGLPSDKDFQEENDRYRQQQFRLVEVSALSVGPSFRGSSHTVSLLLMKFLYNYSIQYMDCSRMVCTVHPRAETFYKALWHFERNGKEVSYGFVQGALAVHLSMDMNDQKKYEIVASYGSTDINKNLALFVLANDKRFAYPSRVDGQVLDPVMTPDLLRYFFTERARFVDEFPLKDLHLIFSLYSEKFSDEELRGLYSKDTERLASSENLVEREYRTPIHLRAILHHGKTAYFCTIFDIASMGCFVSFPHEVKLDGEQAVRMTATVGTKNFDLAGTIAWKNDSSILRLPRGYGIRFIAAQTDLIDEINGWGPLGRSVNK